MEIKGTKIRVIGWNRALYEGDCVKMFFDSRVNVGWIDVIGGTLTISLAEECKVEERQFGELELTPIPYEEMTADQARKGGYV